MQGKLFQRFIKFFRNQQVSERSELTQLKSRLELQQHELRTPLAGIIGMAELIQGGDNPGEQKHYAAALESSARQMAGLIDTLAEATHPKNSEIHGRLFLEQVIRSHWPAAKEKSLALCLTLQPDLPSHWIIDPASLRQVLDNLLANAIKFTDRGHVVVEVLRPGGSRSDRFDLEIQVRDTGMGVKGRLGNRIYSIREQGGLDIGQRFGGSGFGLHISMKAAQRSGGWLVHAANPGGGACFKLVLPGVQSPAWAASGLCRPALLKNLSCRVGLEGPQASVVMKLLSSFRVRIKALADGNLPDLLGDCDAIICHPGLFPGLLGDVYMNSTQEPQIISKLYRGQSSRVSKQAGFQRIALPQPILHSNLEPLLLRIALQKKAAGFSESPD